MRTTVFNESYHRTDLVVPARFVQPVQMYGVLGQSVGPVNSAYLVLPWADFSIVRHWKMMQEKTDLERCPKDRSPKVFQTSLRETDAAHEVGETGIGAHGVHGPIFHEREPAVAFRICHIQQLKGPVVLASPI
jgi:hypothetical protein